MGISHGDATREISGCSAAAIFASLARNVPDRPVIVPHGSFESLLDALPREWLGGAASPIPQPVVIPSIPFSDYLQLRIAQRFGVCMGLDFLTPRDFVFRAVGRNGEEAWSRRFLTWRILPHMADHAARLGIGDPSSRDRFALAEIAADRFDQYGHFRPEILTAWAAGKSAFEPGDEDEKWQRALWLELRAEAGVPHPAEQFQQLRAGADFRRELARRFPRLLVLGSGVLDPLLVQTLDLLADAGGRVEVHILLPSMEFLGDLRARRALPSAEQDPEAIEAGSGHPLLESMGRQSVGAFLLLGRLDDQYTRWPAADAPAAGGASLLARLQADIRALRPPSPAPWTDGDASLRVHSCFGPRREMETLKDEILRAFRDLPDLKPEEVHIVTPSLEVYAPLVPAILEQGEPALTVGLMERPAGDGEPLIVAALALLEITRGGRFEASWLMELIQLDAVQAALGIAGNDDAVERLRTAIRASGVTRGLGADRPGAWGFARDRLIAGRWFGTDNASTYPDDTFVLPVAAQLGGNDDLSRRFIEWFAALEEILRGWREMAPPSEWARRLETASAALLADEDDALALRTHLEFLRGVACDEPVDSGTIADWLASESSGKGRRSLVSGRIAFGRLRQLQNMPCRVLAMVGMQEGAFPGQDRPPTWDLLRKSPRAWDRNIRVDDRQLFLDALLAPRDRLIVTASARNVRTRKTEPFSSCVDELLRVAARMGAPREALVVEHRLQPFAADYFTPAAAVPRSFSRELARVAAEIGADSAGTSQPFYAAEEKSDSPAARPLSLAQLIAFWRNPAKAFLQAHGIVLPQDAVDDEALDRVEIALDGLGAWKLRNAILEEIGASTKDLRRTEARLHADRELPPGHLGDSAWHAQLAAAEPLGEALQSLMGETRAMEITLPDGTTIAGAVPLTRAADRLLAYRVSKFSGPESCLSPWITAVFASACGQPLPSALLDSAAPKAPHERPAVPPEEAASLLAHLVEGFRIGHERPLPYAPATSQALAKALRKHSETEDALAAAINEWEKSGWGPLGEGTRPEARWAWRDRDPFAQPDEWCEWARRIAEPLEEWGDFA